MTSLTHRTVYTLLALTLTSAFNIEIQNPTVFQGSSAESYFGYRVRRFGSDRDTRFLVSAPLERQGNRSGALYKCNFQSSKCDSIPLPGTEHLHLEGIGLSLTVDPRTSPKLIMCAPSLSYTCGRNTYINCMCFEFDSSLTLTRNLTPTYQECPRVKLDVAFPHRWFRQHHGGRLQGHEGVHEDSDEDFSGKGCAVFRHRPDGISLRQVCESDGQRRPDR
ncbi:integrin alpha-M-like isoform X2 [Chiloscyllium punctatum]|uniref:integrin alpha-M-like isoform X2 n=1 Tax=Chiloscyllium punctatum TaxID=137246 RepID=UPI003B63B6C4